jgi:hypothetical protein
MKIVLIGKLPLNAKANNQIAIKAENNVSSKIFNCEVLVKKIKIVFKKVLFKKLS